MRRSRPHPKTTSRSRWPASFLRRISCSSTTSVPDIPARTLPLMLSGEKLRSGRKESVTSPSPRAVIAQIKALGSMLILSRACWPSCSSARFCRARRPGSETICGMWFRSFWCSSAGWSGWPFSSNDFREVALVRFNHDLQDVLFRRLVGVAIHPRRVVIGVAVQLVLARRCRTISSGIDVCAASSRTTFLGKERKKGNQNRRLSRAICFMKEGPRDEQGKTQLCS